MSRKLPPVVSSYGFEPPLGSDALADYASELDRTSARQTIMVDELHHRLQNTLSIVLALSRLTARTVTTVDEFQLAFSHRIEAMARTNALMLRGHVQAVSVQIALEAELQQYLDGKGQVTLDCVSLEVSSDAALSLSLIFHELATNAAKYGALSCPDGRVLVSWNVGTAGLQIAWQEVGGPPVRTPTREGFGSRFVRQMLAKKGGSIKTEWLEAGVVHKILLPTH